ncbi:hypothetical protein H3V53_03500 [Paraburkholderia bengalensis]|uniref:Uncharacterized protein n=1 Tax=Paraburkholderia bengalensis TaxID=2747562 RepID=A0ABU8IL32_9BURK
MVEGELLPIGLDSGTTKIFSSVCENFATSDGRVGAALGALVARWNEEANGGDHKAIPECLRFGHWPQDKNRWRDPKPDHHPRHVYPILSEANGLRIGQNLRVNWVCRFLATAANGTGFTVFKCAAKRVRPLEAALFMVGYAVR